MMNIFQAVLLGVVEGLTEFLPISSTFHLILASTILGIPQTDFVKLFSVFIQAGAILAVLFIYGRELITEKELIKKVLVSFIPTATIGLVLYKIIKQVFFESVPLMVGAFVLVGILFFVVEYAVKRRKLRLSKSMKELTYRDAFLVGLIQALAVVPGVSRAGAVIVGSMFLKFRRDQAAKYSFLLAVPTILAASAYDLYQMRGTLYANGTNLFLLVVGSVTAFVSAYFVVRWFIGFLKTRTLTVFAFYRFIIAIIVILILLK